MQPSICCNILIYKTGSLIDIIIVWIQGKGEQDDAGRKMLDGDEREEDRRRERGVSRGRWLSGNRV